MGFGRELKAVKKDNTTIPVEVALNPYTDNGRSLVLVSIIDLSHRQIQMQGDAGSDLSSLC